MSEKKNESKGRLLRGRLTVRPGAAVEFTEEANLDEGDETATKSKILAETIGTTLVARAKASRALLSGRLASQASTVSQYLRGWCNIIVICCRDGILVRYERSSGDRDELRCGIVDASLSKIVPGLSENVIHFPEDPLTYDPGTNGPVIAMTKTGPDGSQETFVIGRPIIMIRTNQAGGLETPRPGGRPPYLAAFDNDFDMQTGGLIVDATPPPKAAVQKPQQFLTHNRSRWPVGWERIEIYPILGDEYWRPEFAPIWAELDLLGTIERRNSLTAELLKLDGRGKARKEAIALLAEFESLLEGDEEPVHQFLKRNPKLLSLSYEYIWSKLPFGDRVSDFVFREPQNEYILVEIEAPYRELFTKDSQPRHELTHAMKQIRDWVQFIVDNREKVEEELGLTGITVSPRRLIVIGRSRDLTEIHRQNLKALEIEQGRLRIMTYDDVLVAARQSFEKILGPLQIRVENADIFYFDRPIPQEEK